jgi:GTP-binding protein HflX
VILVGVDRKSAHQTWSTQDSLNELASLAVSAGAEVVGRLTQKLDAPSHQSYFGKGKLDELLQLKEKLNFESVIVDDELSPQQQQAMEDLLETKVIDRVGLILDIFARRAHTREGKLQVELAQYEYSLPRLVGKWQHLERLGGGIGTRGPGESQLETDKRIMRQKITRLKKQLEEISRQRDLYRQNRRSSGIPTVALVGYTNSGKSTLLNALSKSDVLARNELFSTLDPTTRRLMLPGRRPVLLTDTVGFIRKLPTTLVAAFRATLEELSDAALLIHVVDITSSNAADQFNTVEEILKTLKLADKPRITALNKIDVILPAGEKWDEVKAIEYYIAQSGEPAPDTVLISAYKKWGFNGLYKLIAAKLPEQIDNTSLQSCL